MNYQEVLDFLYTQLPMYQRVGKVAFKKDLTNTLRLAQHLEDPQDKFKSIHVAGTNGKGSTSHLLAAILQSAGYKVGLYTSPHLKSFRERIRINGKEVSERFVVEFITSNKNIIQEISPSFFEITVVMAMACFAEEQVDFAIIETGLGGRLDSTNIIRPELSIITSISLDHQDMLGETIEEIAREKAGIIKNGRPVIVGRLPEEALLVIKSVANEMKSECIKANQPQWQIKKLNSELAESVLDLNLATVIESVDQLRKMGYTIESNQILEGISKVVSLTGLKGRWQQIRKRPRVICDVGHNEEAVHWLMEELKKIPHRTLHMVWGTVAEKSIGKIFPLLINDAKYYFCAANVPRAMPVEELYEHARQYGLKGSTYASVMKAYEHALSSAHEDDLIFIGGSTFVVAEINDL